MCDGITESSLFGFCHCDEICYNLNDCCSDISDINCTSRGKSIAPVCKIIVHYS